MDCAARTATLALLLVGYVAPAACLSASFEAPGLAKSLPFCQREDAFKGLVKGGGLIGRLRGGMDAKSKAAETASPSTADVRFQWPDTEGLTTVEVSGSWDNWSKVTPLEKKGKVYEMVLQLPQGSHTYKFILNGSKWVCSDAVPQKTDPDGNKNNMVSISHSDVVHHRMKGQKPSHSGSMKDSFMALLLGVVKLGSAAAAVLLGVYIYQHEIKPRWLD
uniref:AMP-activated protein kinase glycogen-binding domain-containing protein n=1 Tax=Hemiselmis andersenii TaxID=464988 RepID=A0A6U2AYA9_HEMAN